MTELYFRYRVHPVQARAFEHAYGPTGPWAKLFGLSPNYRGTRLFRHRTETATYLTVDLWNSKRDYDDFRAEHSEAYARLDRQLRMLYLEELLLGYYEERDEPHPARSVPDA